MKKDTDVLRLLKKHHALTHTEIKQYLHYKNSILIRLRSMLKTNKIKTITIPTNSACKHKLFREYAGLQLYYINEEHLEQWLRIHLPVNPTSGVKQAITMRMRKDFGLKRWRYG